MHSAVVILHYRHAALTQRCLESLLPALGPQDTVWVVDNASHNGSLESLQRCFPQAAIRWLPQADNLGFAGGCNAGIDAALADGAEAVLLLNNDTQVRADMLTHFREAHGRYRGQAVLTGCIDTPDGEPWYRGGHYSLWSVRTTHWHYPLQQEQSVPFATGCLLWLPRAVLAAVPHLDPAYFLYLEDLDYCLQVRAAGFPLVCLPQIQILHAASSSTGGRESPLSVYYQNRNRWRLLIRHGRLWHWMVFLPVYLVGFLRRLRLPLAQRQASIQALADALRGCWGRQQT